MEKFLNQFTPPQNPIELDNSSLFYQNQLFDKDLLSEDYDSSPKRALFASLSPLKPGFNQ